MGSSQSHEPPLRRNSSKQIRQSKKPNKHGELDPKLEAIENVKTEIDLFGGNRQSERYSQIQQILTSISKDFQEAKVTSSKQKVRNKCDDALIEVQNCLKRLESRVDFNEQVLDSAAVESHSFITSYKPQQAALLEVEKAKNLPPPSTRKQRDRADSIKTLDNIEQETIKLEKHIKLCVQLEDHNQLKLLEKKITILYTDLEMISVDNHTPLSEKKAIIGKRLIKCNNQIKKSRQPIIQSSDKIHISKQKSIEVHNGESLESSLDASVQPALLDEERAKNLLPPSHRKPKDPNDFIHTLNRIEQETQKLEQDVKLSIELDDQNQFKILKKKIQILYTDLEMVVVDNNTQLSERKAIIGKKLIKLNNLLRKGKRTSLHVMENIDTKLENLGIEALTFEGIKNDDKYQELKEELENYWTLLYPLDTVSSEEKNKKDHLVAKIKNTLEELSSRAEENLKQFEALEKLNEQINKVKELQEKSGNFKGSVNDSTFLKLDQELRTIWDALSDVDEINEHVRRRKASAIDEIKFALNTLNENATRQSVYENVTLTDQKQITEDEIEEIQLFNQVKEFENHWNQLNYNLVVLKIINSSISKSIIDIFTKISGGIGKKVNALESIEKRKSTSSLVTVKIFDSVDEVKKEHQPIETEIKAKPGVKAIGEMQRIGSQAKIILQQVRESNCTKNDKEYERFSTMLEECKTSLEKIEYNKKSDTIESNKRRALKIVMEAIRVLDERPTSSRTSKAYEVMDVYAEIQYFRQHIKTFNGVTKDSNYSKIKQGLTECLAKLQLIDDGHALKQDNIRQIQLYHQELESKLAENQAKVKINQKNAEMKRQISHETKAIIEEVQKLKSQVERFNGVFDGIQFKQIQENLQKCTQKLDGIDTFGDEKLESARVQTKQKIRKYLRILEEKSSKPEIIPETPQKIVEESPHLKINTLRDQLVGIKSKTEKFNGHYKDQEYNQIEDDLSNCMKQLKIIDDRGHKSIALSKQQYEDYIVKLLEYFEDKTKLKEAADDVTQTVKIVDPTEELSTIGLKIADLKSKIDEDPSDLSELKAQEEALTHQVSNIEVGNVGHVRERKKLLMEDLEEYRKIIELRIKNKEIFNKILVKIEETSDEIKQFVGTKNDKNYCQLDEVLIQLMLELDKIDYAGNVEFKNAKKNAIQLIQQNMFKLDERVASSSFGATVI